MADMIALAHLVAAATDTQDQQKQNQKIHPASVPIPPHAPGYKAAESEAIATLEASAAGAVAAAADAGEWGAGEWEEGAEWDGAAGELAAGETIGSPCLPDDLPDDDVNACIGKVKSYNIAKGFGFVIPEEVDPNMPGDVFFRGAELGPEFQQFGHALGALVNRRVAYNLEAGTDGKAKVSAGSLQLLDRVEQRAAAVTSYSAPQPHSAPPPADAKVGHIKSFSMKTGYGFIRPVGGDGSTDARFVAGDVPPMFRNRRIDGFEAHYTEQPLPDGKLRVRWLDIKEVGQVGHPAHLARPAHSAHPAHPAHLARPNRQHVPVPVPVPSSRHGANQAADKLLGLIKMYDPVQCLGLIEAPGVGGDVYFEQKLGPQAQEGEQVSFEIDWLDDGTSRGRNVRLDHSPLVGGHSSGEGHAGGPSAPTAPPGSALQEGFSYLGTIKNYGVSKEFGFVTTTEHQTDIFFQRRDLSPPLQSLLLQRQSILGAEVCFSVVQQNSDGRWAARGLQLAGADTHQGASSEAPAAKRARHGDIHPGGPAKGSMAPLGATCGNMAEPGGSRLNGTIKTYSTMKGFGFIVSDGCEGDVFFMRSQLPDEISTQTGDHIARALRGQSVSFEPEVGPDGKMRGSDIKLY